MVNLIAVLICGVVGQIIGGLWYSPLLFGKVWMKLTGFTDEDAKKAQEKGMAKVMTVSFIAVLILSYVMAKIFELVIVTTVLGGVGIALLLWSGFVATIMLNGVLWENKPVKLYILNIAHYFVSFVSFGLILSIWS